MTLGKLATDSTDHIVTPAELLAVPLSNLLDVWNHHRAALVASAPGPAELLPVGWRRGHALDALALGEAIAQTVRAGRWATALDALEGGASVADVGTALGLRPDEVDAGVRTWAAGQYRHELIDRSRRNKILAVLADRDGGAR